jgi:hypothetical protein
LKMLLALRAEAREQLEKATNPVMVAAYDLRQLVLKLNANSTYGFYGAMSSPLYTQEVAASVTARGSTMIKMVVQHVQNDYTIATGMNADYVVLYGDTDSVMIKVPLASLTPAATATCDRLFNIICSELDNFAKKNPYKTHSNKDGMTPDIYDSIVVQIKNHQLRASDRCAYLEAIPYFKILSGLMLGNYISKTATGLFSDYKVIKMAFEKVYMNYLLVAKKRYAGLYFTRPHIHDKIDVKGLETKRRDPCLFFINTFKEALERLILRGDKEGALRYAQERREDLVAGKISLFELINTKQYNKLSDDYASPQAHAELVLRNQSDTKLPQYKLGDRVQFIVTKPINKKAQLYQHVDNPLSVAEHRLAIDEEYYSGEHYLKPVGRMFGPIINPPIQKVVRDNDGNITFERGAAPELILTRKSDIQKVANTLNKYSTRKDRVTKGITTTTAGAVDNKKITSFFSQRVEKCLVCNVDLSASQHAVCECCQQNGGLAKYLETKRKEDVALRAAMKKSEDKCFKCAGELAVNCRNSDCSERYDRFTRDHQWNGLQTARQKLSIDNLEW